jgi:hypothetical protein
MFIPAPSLTEEQGLYSVYPTPTRPVAYPGWFQVLSLDVHYKRKMGGRISPAHLVLHDI